MQLSCDSTVIKMISVNSLSIGNAEEMMLSGRTSLMRGISDRVFRGSSSPAKAHGFAATTVLIAFLLRYFLMGVLVSARN